MNINENQMQDIYQNEGIAIFAKGKMILGIHPDNVENNVKSLDNGSMKINWECLLDTVNHNPIVDEGEKCIIEFIDKDKK
jgi:hypothetical protein